MTLSTVTAASRAESVSSSLPSSSSSSTSLSSPSMFASSLSSSSSSSFPPSSSSPSAPETSAGKIALDPRCIPHIFDSIIESADLETLANLRNTVRALREQIPFTRVLSIIGSGGTTPKVAVQSSRGVVAHLSRGPTRFLTPCITDSGIKWRQYFKYHLGIVDLINCPSYYEGIPELRPGTVRTHAGNLKDVSAKTAVILKDLSNNIWDHKVRLHRNQGSKCVYALQYHTQTLGWSSLPANIFKYPHLVFHFCLHPTVDRSSPLSPEWTVDTVISSYLVQLAVALNFKVINALHGEMFTNALSTVELVGFDEMPIQDTRLCATDNAVEHLQQVWRSALHQVAPVKSLRDKIIACVSFLTVDEYKDKYRDTLSDVQVAFEQGKDFGNEDALKFLDRKKYGRCRHTATLKHWCTHLCEHSHSDRTRHRSETRIRFAEDVALE